ncbi:MAG: hypothetical protein QXT25_03225 [Candidatus Anstonellaceae archaeon]
MAYGRLFSGKAEGLDVVLWLKNWVGVEYEMPLTEARIRWTGADEGITSLISTSRGIVTFVVTNPAAKSLALSIVQKQERDYILQIGDWYGVVLQDQCKLSDTAQWLLTVEAVDGLAVNREITAEIGTPVATLAYWTYQLLLKLANDMRPLKVRVASNLVAQNAVGTQTFFNTALFGANGWAGQWNKDGVFEWKTARQALEEICYAFGLRLFYADDYYYFIQADKFPENVLEFAEFNNPNALSTTDFTLVELNRKEEPVRLAGGLFSYRPELKAIRQDISSDLSALMYQQSGIAPSTTFTVSFARYDGIQGYVLNIAFNGKFSNVLQSGQIRLKLYLRSNNLIYTNAGNWVSGGVYNYLSGYFLDPFLPEEYAEVSFSINVGNLPSTLLTDFRYEVDVVNAANQTVSHTLSDAAVELQALADVAQAAFAIEVLDNSSASSVIETLRSTAITPFAKEFAPARPRVWDGNAWVFASVNWPTQSLHLVVLSQMFSYYDNPVEVYEGEIWRQYVSPLNTVVMDTGDYFVLDCERDYKERLSRVTLFKNTRQNRTVQQATITVGGPPLGLSPNPGVGSSNVGLAGVTAAVIKDITGTTVEVFSIPVNLEAGTNIIIANPTTGQWEERTVTGQTGVNISINSALNGTYPQGAVLVISPVEVLRLLSN